MESVQRNNIVNMKIKFRGQWTTEFIWNIFDDAFLKIQFDFFFFFCRISSVRVEV